MNAQASSSKEDSQLVIYVSAALGAFFLGIGDLLNNSGAATVVKLSEVIRQNIYPQMGSGGLGALLLLGFFGAAGCWIHQPKTRIDAFARGFSVFAIMAVTAPYSPPPTGLNHSFDNRAGAIAISSIFGIAPAYADETARKYPLEITLVTGSGSVLPSDTRVILREYDTGRIVGSSNVVSSRFTISQPKGIYLVEVEASGMRRTSAKIRIEEVNKGVSVHLDDSRVPLGIQRLYSPERK